MKIKWTLPRHRNLFVRRSWECGILTQRYQVTWDFAFCALVDDVAVWRQYGIPYRDMKKNFSFFVCCKLEKYQHPIKQRRCTWVSWRKLHVAESEKKKKTGPAHKILLIAELKFRRFCSVLLVLTRSLKVLWTCFSKFDTSFKDTFYVHATHLWLSDLTWWRNIENKNHYYCSMSR